MTSEIVYDAEVRDEADPPNSSSVDGSDLEIPCSGSADGHSTDDEGGEDGGFEDSQPSLKRLLLRIAADEDSSIELSLREFLDKLKSEGKFQQADCDAALHVAARHGLVDEARELIDAGANVSAPDKKQRQPLHKAFSKGYTELAELLLNSDADIEGEQTKSVLNENHKIQATDENGWSALHWASRNGHDEVVQRLLAADMSNIDAPEENESWTALHIATYYGHIGVVTTLLKSRASLGSRDNDGWTPLMTATKKENSDAMRQLLQFARSKDSGHLETRDDLGWTPLLAACKSGFSDGARQLIAAGADRNAQSEDSKSTPLMVAGSWLYLEIVNDLLAAGASVNIQDVDGQTALHEASRENYTEIVQRLLEQSGINIEVVDKNGQTALHLASERGNESVVKLLLENNAKVDATDKKSRTALHLASDARDEDQSDPDPDEVGSHGLTDKETSNPELRSGRHSAVVLLLLKKGAKPGDHALEWAARDSKSHAVAKWLLQKRPDKTKSEPFPGSNGWSVMEWAVYKQLPGIVLLLIAASERTPEVDRDLESALELVKSIKKRLKSSKSPQERVDISRTNEEKGSDKGQTEHDLQRTKPEQKGQKGLQSKDLDTIKDILCDPPFIQMRKGSKKYGLPRPRGTPGIEDVLMNFEATVVQFYKEGAVSTIRRNRSVKEVIYDAGPTKIMKTAIEFLDSVISKSPELSSQATYSETEPKFTWVHLPSTNIDWMNDLLTRIMKDEKRKTPQYHEVRSFFRDSWVEIPDRTSLSRFMRPRTVMRQQATSRGEDVKGEGTNKTDKIACREELASSDEEEEKRLHDETEEAQEDKSLTDGAGEEENNVKAEKSRPKKKAAGFIAASAVYMPYFCFSTLCGEQPKPSDEQKKFKKAQANYDKLLEAYPNRTIHGSPTLDEWYYHFGPDSSGDRNHRNETQVVTKFLKAHKMLQQREGN